MEAQSYYAGLPTAPVLVARASGASLEEPICPDRRLKAFHPPIDYPPLEKIWDRTLAPKLHKLLGSMEVDWTSLELLRIGYANESFAPLILWIGMVPGSLPGDDGLGVASGCHELFGEHGITDINVEIRESVVTSLAGPKLLKPAQSSDPTAVVVEPLTATLGLPISAQSRPSGMGTGGFFFTEKAKPGKLFLVTARHVIFPPDKNDFHQYKRGGPRINVMLFSDQGFEDYLEVICTKTKEQGVIAGRLKEEIKTLVGNQLRKAQDELSNVEQAIRSFDLFYKEVSTHWADPKKRILGHVLLSPPIELGAGDEHFTEDWAIIEIDPSKVTVGRNFDGNAIDLGFTPAHELNSMMHPSAQNPRSFTYPPDRLLKLEGVIPIEEMAHPTALNRDSRRCITVIKRGAATHLTIGYALGFSAYRRHPGGGIEGISKEWAIEPLFSDENEIFSVGGDSGSVIVDGHGRIGGLLTSGSGRPLANSIDITYATPVSFILERIRLHGLKPVLAIQARSQDRFPSSSRKVR